MVGQLYETAADVDREFQKGIVRRGFAATFAHLHSQVNVFVVFTVQQLDGREPYRHDEPVQFLFVERLDKLQLFGRDFRIGYEVDIFLFQFLRNRAYRLFIVFYIACIQFPNLFEQFFGFLPLFGSRFVHALGNTVLRSHSYPEKLIQVVGIDAKKCHPFQQGHMTTGCFLQNPAVKVHPADVSFQIRLFFFSISCYHKITFFAKKRILCYKMISKRFFRIFYTNSSTMYMPCRVFCGAKRSISFSMMYSADLTHSPNSRLGL